MQHTFQSPWFSTLLGYHKHKIYVGANQIEIDTLSIFQFSQCTHRILFKEIDSVHTVKKNIFTELHIQLKTGGHFMIPSISHRTAFKLKCCLSAKL